MSKIVMSLPEGMIKTGVNGAFISLVCYVLLQFLSAFLICREIAGEEMLYPMVCLSAGISAFAGCWYGTARSKKGGVLGAATVVVVFLALTVTIGFLCGKVGVVGNGLVGVGVSMSVGGLAAALFSAMKGEGAGAKRERGKRRRDKRR